MAGIPRAQQVIILAALDKAGAKLPCPRCGNPDFSLVDGYFNQPIQSQLAEVVMGGQSVPSVVVVCNRCGFISQHALGALKLLGQNPGPGKGT